MRAWLLTRLVPDRLVSTRQLIRALAALAGFMGLGISQACLQLCLPWVRLAGRLHVSCSSFFLFAPNELHLKSGGEADIVAELWGERRGKKRNELGKHLV